MKRKALLHLSLFVSLVLALAHASHAQLIAGPGVTDTTSRQPVSNRTFSFSGTIPGQLDGALSVTFSIYPDQQSATALWTETQVVQITAEKYSVMLGSTSATGLPSEIFSADQSHWLGVQVNGTEKRYLLVSVPYAMKAVNADQLGGLPFSEYVTAQQLQAALQGATTGTTPQPKVTSTAPTGQAAVAGTPPQPATDFTDNNTSEVLLVTQQGTGYAIHAISNLQPAIYAENNNLTGIALQVVETSTAGGASTGLLAQTLGSGSVAGVFDSAGPEILELRKSGTRMVFFDQFGGMTANGEVRASDFAGSGSGLTNIPNSATTATSSNISNSIVARDFNGGFVAGTIQATSFVGSGFGLTDIPQTAINATPLTINNSVVARDSTGSFSANQILANNFSGSGSGLFNIPPTAINATPINIPNSVVARDNTGSFNANQVTANTFSGSGAGLFNIPPGAVNGTPINIPNSVVARDGNGSFNANQIFANNFLGNGSGLSNIPPTAVNATPINIPNSVVARDGNGNFNANQIFANNFLGNGNGLFNIPPSAVGASSDTLPNAIVMRDASGNFSANNVFTSVLNVSGQFSNAGLTDLSNGSTLPVHAVTSANTPLGCIASRELLIKTDAAPGQQLFICNATSDGWNLVGDGVAAGIGSIAAGDPSITIGGPASAPTIAVTDGSITSVKLAPNAVVSSIADGSLSPAKITGTAATLGSNTFLADQTIQTNLTVKGTLLNNLGLRTSNLFVSESTPSSITQLGAGPALVVAGGSTGISISGSGTALSATADFGTTVTAQNTTATALQGIGPVGVDAVTATGVGLQARTTGASGIAATFTNANTGKLISGRLGLSVPVEMFSVDTSGNLFAAGALITQFPNDNKTSGTALSVLAELTPAGTAVRASDSSGIIGIVVGGAGFSGNAQIAYGGIATCAFHTTTQAGDYVQNFGDGFCKDVGPSYPTSGQVVGRVLQSVPITDFVAPVLLFGPEQRTFPPVSGVTTINTGSGLIGGPITSSGTISIANSGVTNAMLQNSSVSVTTGAGLSGGGVVPLGGFVALSNTGALSFNGRAGNVLPAQGDYSFSQLNGAVSPAQLPPSVVYNNQGNNFSGRQVITGTAAVSDSSASGGLPALESFSQNNVAGEFISNAPFVLIAGNTTTGGLLSLTNSGVLTVTGNIFGSSFIGDGSRLTSVNAASVGGVTAASLATTSGLNAETAARQSDTNTLQTNINNVSAADAKLAASNTFTTGTQDFSGAGATLPVRSVLTANTPTACIAGKELLIKTDAPAGQQLFICDASGTTWVLVGDGAANGVSSFNGRNGSVSPASGDYSFAQISGAAAAGQLPSNVVYNNQANSFTGNQTVNGSVTATSFSGSGSGVTGVNAASLNGIPSNAFAQLHAINTFTSEQAFAASTAVNPSLNIPAGVAPATPLAGDVWNTGSTLQYRDNASTTRSLVSTNQSGGLQLLKLTASISPASVGSQACTEQSFTVSGISSGDVLLGVSQPSTSSPGTNIAIGGFRVSAANTVAVQFCNVSRNNSTPTAGVYTFALMR